jgi:chromosomal replication initiator protein
MDDEKVDGPQTQMKAWERFVAALQKEFPALGGHPWLHALRLVRFDAANLYLEAASPIELAWFEEHIRPLLKKNLFNENFRPIKVHVQAAGAKVASAASVGITSTPFSPSPLDPGLTLNHFISTEQNNVVVKLIQEWLKKGASPFNPLFLFGPESSGKTHLLMSLADALQTKKQKVFYVTADTFTEHVVQAIRGGRMQEFRSIYRDIDVLLVDNIHRLAGRAATQEEFFHTFNNLHTLGKQIVLSSPVAPSKIEEIEPRLISRFEWGIVLPLERLPSSILLEKKAQMWDIPLSPELATFLLTRFPSNPLLALQALALRVPGKEPISVLAAEKILKDLLAKEEAKGSTPEKIVKALSAHFGIKPEDLTGKSQTREFALPRQIAMYLCRKNLNLPFQTIGKFFSRDHSTVMSSVKQIEQACEGKQAKVLEAVEVGGKNS